MAPKRIIAAGDMVADLLLPSLPDLPERDMQLLLEGVDLSPGGNTLNFALAASAFGARLEFHAARGNDAMGDFLSSWVRAFGALDRSRVLEGARTATTIAIPDRSGGRRLLTYPGANSDLVFSPDELDLPGAWHLHTGGYCFLSSMIGTNYERVLEACRDGGVETSMDPATDPRGWSNGLVEGLLSMLPLIDFLFLNTAELKGLTREKDIGAGADLLLDRGAGRLLVHRGEEGASLISKDVRVDVKAFPVDVPLNPTGCGDVLNGCFTAARALGGSDEEALGLGVAAASLHLSRSGPYYPTLSEARHTLERSNASQY